MPALTAAGLQDDSIRTAFQRANRNNKIYEKEIKKIIQSVDDGAVISRREIEDLRRIYLDAEGLTPRANILLRDFLIQLDRMAGSRSHLDLLPVKYGRRFDSQLKRPSSGSRIWHLTLEARVNLVEQNFNLRTCKVRGSSRNCSPWPDGEFERFKQKIKQQSRFWTDRFYLRPPSGLRSLDVKERSDPPFVLCKFNLEFVTPGSRRHKTINAVYLHPQATEMRSHSRLYDNRDVDSRDTTREGQEYKRVTLWHELGHLLGIDHIGEIRGYSECGPTSDTNARVCYGKNHQDRSDVMGIGTIMRSIHATPWVNSIAELTFSKPEDWGVVVNTSQTDKYQLR